MRALDRRRPGCAILWVSGARTWLKSETAGRTQDPTRHQILGQMDRPTIELFYRDREGKTRVQRKFWPSLRPISRASISEWISEYLDAVRSGYRPEGYDCVPIPHCARIHAWGHVAAEWINRNLSREFSAESPVTADERSRREGVPANTPSTPCSESVAWPQVDTGGICTDQNCGSRAVNDARTASSTDATGSGQPVAQAGPSPEGHEPKSGGLGYVH
jgi:hypothetical protein